MAIAIDHELLRKLVMSRNLLFGELARASEIAPSSLSAHVNGWQLLGPKREAGLRKGLTKLGFSTKEITKIFTPPIDLD